MTQPTSVKTSTISQVAIADGYVAAIKVIHAAKLPYIDLKPLNDKMWRVINYLQTQAAAELAETLS